MIKLKAWWNFSMKHRGFMPSSARSDSDRLTELPDDRTENYTMGCPKAKTWLIC